MAYKAACIPFCFKIDDSQAGRQRNGSAAFRYLEDTDSQYSERTQTIDGIVMPSKVAEGKFDVTFEIPKLGDVAHTFILKTDYDTHTTNDDEQMFDSYELSGPIIGVDADKSYKQSMTYDVNKTLARGAGWAYDTWSHISIVPLMIRETVDHFKTFLPIISGYDAISDTDIRGRQSHKLVIYGFTNIKDAKACSLDIDFVYLDTLARRVLAQKQQPIPMAICNYITEEVEFAFSNATTTTRTVNYRLKGPSKEVNTVTGILIHAQNKSDLRNISLKINGCQFCGWNEKDEDLAWIKVGMTEPMDNSILLPFSRAMWSDPENAPFVDFSRIDDIEFSFTVLDSYEGNLKLKITPLAYTTRTLTSSRYFIGSA